MEISEQIAFGGQLLILFKSIVLILLLFLFGYLSFPRKSQNIFLIFANRVGISLIFASSLFASFYIGGRTMVLPFSLLFAVLVFFNFKNKKFRLSDFRSLYSFQFLLPFLIFILLFILNSILTQPYDDQGIIIVNPDISTYANWSKLLMESRVESLPHEMSIAKSAQSFYHFIDLWFVGWGSRLFNNNNYIFYSLVYKPLLQSILLSFIIGFARRFNISKNFRLLSVFIIVSTALYPFLRFENAPWYLDFSATSYPLYHYIGTYFVSVYLFVVLSAFLFFRKELLAVVLLSLLGLVNPLFIAVTPLFFFLVLAIWFLQKKVKLLDSINVVRDEKWQTYLLGFIISVALLLFFKIFIIGSESTGVVDIFRIKTYAVAANVFFRTIFVSIIYFPVCVIGYLFLVRNFPAYRRTTILFLYLFVSGTIFMSLVFENVQGNILQLINMLWNFPLIVLGSFGFLLLLSKTKNYKAPLIALFAVSSLWSVYNTFSEKYSSFHPVYKFNHPGNLVKYSDIDQLNEIVTKHGSRGGYFLNTDGDTRNLNLSEFITYNAFTDKYSNTYRLNVVKFDEQNIDANKVYKNTLLYELKDTGRNKFPAITDRLSINWLVVDDNRFVFPEELKSIFTEEYQLDGFRIFAKPR